MAKYKLQGRDIALNRISNELAEANRLKRIELCNIISDFDLEDKA